MDWFKKYNNLPEPKRVIQSWDTGIKANEFNDPSACVTIYDCEDGYYLVDVLNERMEFPDLKRAVVSQANKYNPDVVIIEDKGSGQSLIQELRNEKLPIIPFNPKIDKESRARAVTPLIEAGHMSLPNTDKKWLFEFTSQLQYFPRGSHDDMVDALTQALNWLNKPMAAPRIRSF